MNDKLENRLIRMAVIGFLVIVILIIIAMSLVS